jgi:aminopeptidase-like protein
LGQRVATLVNKVQKEGSYRVILDASKISGGLSTGVYIYRFTAGKFSQTKKLLLLK